MAIVLGKELGPKMLKILGIPVHLVGKITINAQASEVATVTIERAISEEEAVALDHLFGEYVFTKRADTSKG